MKEFVDAFNKLFGNVVNTWGPYLLAVAGLGTLTMAILQAIKDATPARRWFQRYKMRQWLNEHALLARKDLGLKCAPDPDEAERQIVKLATDGDYNAFYNLEIEKLCGQWNAAIQIVTDYPEMYKAFFACVAARSDKNDFRLLMPMLFPRETRYVAAGAGEEHLERPSYGEYPEQEAPAPPVSAHTDDKEQHRHASSGSEELADARNRVRRQIQRAVDSFQISTGFRWKWLLQMASLLLTISFAALALLIVKPRPGAWAILWGSAIAGFLAPVARDLLAAVQKLRSP